MYSLNYPVVPATAKLKNQVFIQQFYLGYSSDLCNIFFQNEVLASISQLGILSLLFQKSTTAKSIKICMLCNPTEFKGIDMDLWPIICTECSYLFHIIYNVKCSEIMWYTSHVCLYSKRTCHEHVSLAYKITNQTSKGKQTAFPDRRLMASLAVPDIGNVGHPLEVCWDGIKADKKPRKQKHRDGSNWAHKSGHL